MLAEGFRGACHTRDLVTFNALGRCAKPYLSALRASLRRHRAWDAATVGAHDLSRSLADLHQESTLIVVIEMSQYTFRAVGRIVEDEQGFHDQRPSCCCRFGAAFHREAGFIPLLGAGH